MLATLSVLVKPGTSRCRVTTDGSSLTVWLTARPVEGKANQQLVTMLKEYLGIPAQRIQIIRGKSGKRKLVGIRDMTQEELGAILRSKMEIIATNGS